MRSLTHMSHVLLLLRWMRESLEIIGCFVGVHFFTEAQQVEGGVRTNLIVHSYK